MAAILDLNERLKQRPGQAAASEQQEQRKDVSYDANAQYVHGPGQFLSWPGLDQSVISTVQRVRGLSRVLALLGSRFVHPYYDVITGQTQGEGAEPDDPCDTPPSPGKLKEEALKAPFGLIRRRTDTIDAVSLGRITNRGEHMDLRLINQIASTSPWIPEPARDPNFIGSEIGMKMFMLGLELERVIERMIFTGNGVQGNGFSQFLGLESLVNTGLVGAIGGGLVPALDSTIVNWGNKMLDETATVNGKDVNIVELLSSLLYFVESRAEDTGLAPVQYAIVMPRDLFWLLTEVWPCQYLSTGCNIPITSANREMLLVATGAEQTNIRDDYRNRSYLMINGNPYPVITSEGMSQDAVSNGVSTDIYLLPLTAAGMRMLYMEHFDFNNPELASSTAQMPMGEITTSNNGVYVWTYERSELCWWYSATVRPRLVLRTPWLAARIQNIVYKPVYHTFDGFLGGLYPPPDGGLYNKPWPTIVT